MNAKGHLLEMIMQNGKKEIYIVPLLEGNPDYNKTHDQVLKDQTQTGTTGFSAFQLMDENFIVVNRAQISSIEPTGKILLGTYDTDTNKFTAN